MTETNHFLKTFQKNPEIFSDILGQKQPKAQLQSALASNRHVLIIGPPGIGKTTLAKNVAKLLPVMKLKDCLYHCDPDKPLCPRCRKGEGNVVDIHGNDRFIRIQGSSDLTAEDLLGDIDPVKALEFGPMSIESFTPGKIFMANKGVIFFDEVNRAPEKVQNSLLQLLEEGYATISGYKVDFSSDFILIATMNPEDTSTETLSDVFLDRFDAIHMGYPESESTETDIVKEQAVLASIDAPEDLVSVSTAFVRRLRSSEKLERKPSVRASIGLIERARATAAIDNRTSITLDDIKSAVISVLSHRIRLKPSHRFVLSPEDFLKEELSSFLSKGQHPKNDLGGGL